MMATLEKVYDDASWEIPDDFLSKEHFLRSLQHIDWQSSPGYPYLLRSPTNEIFFGVKDGVPDLERLEYIWQMVSKRIQNLLVGEDECDYIRTFIKGEPLKPKKVQNKEYRIISSVSVIDQIIDHMLFDPMNDRLTEEWVNQPSKVGWSPYVGGWRVVPRLGAIALDKKSWDWTVHMWLLDMVFELRQRLCRNLNDTWVKLARARYRCLYNNPILITSGGMMLRQLIPGLMKSGCVNTISDNSIMQFILHVRVCLELGIPLGSFFWAMGDDVLQEKPQLIEKYLDKLGEYCLVKQYTETAEFAGMLFRGDKVEPLYRGKHAFTLLHVDPKVLPELASSYALLYHRSVYRDWMRSLLTAMGNRLPSLDQCSAIYDSLE